MLYMKQHTLVGGLFAWNVRSRCHAAESSEEGDWACFLFRGTPPPAQNGFGFYFDFPFYPQNRVASKKGTSLFAERQDEMARTR